MEVHQIKISSRAFGCFGGVFCYLVFLHNRWLCLTHVCRTVEHWSQNKLFLCCYTGAGAGALLTLVSRHLLHRCRHRYWHPLRLRPRHLGRDGFGRLDGLGSWRSCRRAKTSCRREGDVASDKLRGREVGDELLSSPRRPLPASEDELPARRRCRQRQAARPRGWGRAAGALLVDLRSQDVGVCRSCWSSPRRRAAGAIGLRLGASCRSRRRCLLRSREVGGELPAACRRAELRLLLDLHNLP